MLKWQNVSAFIKRYSKTALKVVLVLVATLLAIIITNWPLVEWKSAILYAIGWEGAQYSQFLEELPDMLKFFINLAIEIIACKVILKIVEES